MNNKVCIIISFLISFLFVDLPVFSQQSLLGIFDGHEDIGKVKYQSSVVYYEDREEYQIGTAVTDSEDNKEAFNFIWKKLNGDFIMYAEVRLAEKDTTSSIRLGCMIRSSLDKNATNINASVNQKGIATLNFTKTSADSSQESKFLLKDADVIQLEKKDDNYIIRVAKFGEPFITEQVKGVNLGEDVYVGLFMWSENQSTSKKAVCSNIRITIPVPAILSVFRTDIASNLEVLDVETGKRKIIYSDTNSVHAPIWNKDGSTLIYGKQGYLYKLPLSEKVPELINTGTIKNNSNDHVLSFDGKMLALSIPLTGGPLIYTVPVDGGRLKQLNKKGPSYPHGWSPDGKVVLFSASREGEFEIYKVAASGGKEYGITNVPGMDDCPEYSPDGKFIYFISNRTGTMRVWRMKPDGSDAEVVTTGDFNDWFPHISPDGKWIVFLSYSKDEVSASGHPSYRQVYLRLMPISGGQPKVIAYIYGGQGSINSPCWSPDSKKIAFASYSDTQY
jgi:TolB protein